MRAIFLTAGIVIVQRILELRLAKQNQNWSLAHGAKEYGAAHYPLFFILHPGWMLAWMVEAVLRGARLSRVWWLWLTLFAAAQGLRYWAITSLGRFWNTRILVIPDVQLVRTGPYRFLPHPNYLAVAIELAAVPMLFGAWLTAFVAGVLNAALLLGLRIPAEEAALRALEEHASKK
ncbi:MAG: hypothetical protein KDJ52_17965 [Anaerolineae bacterium]|nr:hypothetical protein [Anaerolineae bacterium]